MSSRPHRWRDSTANTLLIKDVPSKMPDALAKVLTLAPPVLEALAEAVRGTATGAAASKPCQ